MYSRIKKAINKTAENHNTDFLLTSGEGLVYSRPVYDLTNEVIKELKNLEKRTSPQVK